MHAGVAPWGSPTYHGLPSVPVTATGNHQAGLQVRPRPHVRIPGRLLRIASDERLVEQLRGGSEAAFEAIFDRHHRAVLAFCRHMLGSAEEAEDAVQHTFLAAYGALTGSDRPIRLRPWLYTIARNRCLSVLRSPHRTVPSDADGPSTEQLAAVVERRQELRDLLGDLSRLPEDQRAALVLAELGGVTHEDIAGVLDCRREKVKALVFQARTSLIASRSARETPCAEIREQLANLSGGALRRGALRRHLSGCAGCREFRDQVREQRRGLALVLPVAPSLGLKSLVLSGSGSAAGAGLAGGVGAASGSLVTKVVLAVAVAGGGTVAVEAARDRPAKPAPPPAATEAAPVAQPAGSYERAAPAAGPPPAAVPFAAPEHGYGPAAAVRAKSPRGRGRGRLGAFKPDSPRGHGHGRLDAGKPRGHGYGGTGTGKPENSRAHGRSGAAQSRGSIAPKTPRGRGHTRSAKPLKTVAPPGLSRSGGAAKPDRPSGAARRAAPTTFPKSAASVPEQPAMTKHVARKQARTPRSEIIAAVEPERPEKAAKVK
jgi:RNA polymerase sigma factor (sigma-70 family)